MNRQVIVFIAIIAAAITLFAFMSYARIPFTVAIALLVVIAVATQFFPELLELKEYERAVVFQLGKYKRTVGPGWVLIFPILEKYVLVDMRTQTIDTPPQTMITRDDVRVKVDAVLYLRVVDPKKAIIEIKDFKTAAVELLKSNIRNAIAKMDLEELLEKTEELDAELQIVIKHGASDWGVAVHRVEVQSIELPPELVVAMRKRKEALEYKTKAEIEASARQISLEILEKAASKMSDRTLAYLYIDALKKISEGKSNKIIFPLELTRLANTLATGGKGGETDYPKIAESLIAAYREQQKRAIDSKLPFAKKKPENEAGEEAQTEMDEAQQKLAAEQESEAEEGQVGAKEAQPAEEVEAAAPMKKARLTRKKPEPGRNKAGKRWSVKAVKEKSKRAAGRKRVRR